MLKALITVDSTIVVHLIRNEDCSAEHDPVLKSLSALSCQRREFSELKKEIFPH